MTTLAGRDVSLKVGGTPLTLTTEATTKTTNQIRQITDATKRAIDPETAVVVAYNGSTVSDTTSYAVNYAQGIITFVADPGALAVTVSGKYVPLLDLLECRSVEIAQPQSVMADVTRMGDTGPRVLEVVKKCSLKVELFTTPTTDVDSGAPVLLLATLLAADRMFVEAKISTTQTLRGWFAPKDSWKHTLNEALVGTIELDGCVQTCMGRPGTDQALFSMV